MMSLKAFHVFFIVVSIVTCLGFSAWTVWDYGLSHRLPHLALGLASGIGGLLLTYYLVKVRSQFKHLGSHS